MERLSQAQLDELRKYDTPTVCNALECFNYKKNTEGTMQPGMFLRTADKTPVVGYAATAKVSANYPDADGHKMLMGYYEHVREMGDPTIAVVQDTDKVPQASFWGEVQAVVHQSLGCIGTMMQGGVRDVDEASRLGFHFYSTEINVSHGYIHVEKYNCPVNILGLTIRPGDLVHFDQHGAAVIPHEVAPRLAAACRAMIEAEYPMLEPCKKAIAEGRKPTMDEIAKWRTAMAEARKKLSEPFGLK